MRYVQSWEVHMSFTLNNYPQTLPYYKISSIPPSAPSTLVVDRVLVLEPFCYVIDCATCLYV